MTKTGDGMLEAIAKDADLTIFNKCIEDLAAGANKAQDGYGIDAITAMLALSSDDPFRCLCPPDSFSKTTTTSTKP